MINQRIRGKRASKRGNDFIQKRELVDLRCGQAD